MKIEKIEFKPMGFSFEPAFHITIYYTYRNDCKLPIKFNAYLFLEDRFIIAQLQEYEFDNKHEEFLTARSANSNREIHGDTTFIAPMSRFVLSKLEEKRNGDPKGDLKFLLRLQIICMEPQFDHVSSMLGPHDNQVVTTLSNQYALLKLQPYNFNETIRIPSGDWLHDYCPVFQNSRYQVFELPIPNNFKGSGKLSERINAAIASLELMEIAKLEGEWKKLIKDSRPIWELIRDRSEIEALLKDDGLSSEAIKSFNELINALFNFSAKFIHKESLSKDVMANNNPSKEDAELIYALSIAIVNLIAKKINK